MSVFLLKLSKNLSSLKNNPNGYQKNPNLNKV